MSRWLVLFFVVLLPLQFAGSVASAYCQHETTAAGAAHVGHHAHVHQAEAKKVTAKLTDTGFSADADCGACHAAALPLISAGDAPPAVHRAALLRAGFYPPRHASALARAPDRPQWRRLV